MNHDFDQDGMPKKYKFTCPWSRCDFLVYTSEAEGEELDHCPKCGDITNRAVLDIVEYYKGRTTYKDG